MQKSKLTKGFTLLELLIVFSIISILSAAGVASFVSYNKSQLVNEAAWDVESTLQLARSRTLSLIKPSQGVCLLNALDGYRVDIVIAAGTYQLVAVCNGFDYIIPDSYKKLPVGVSFKNTSTISSVFFRVINGGVIGSGRVDLTGYGQDRSVTVDGIGKIKKT